ncbi:hypothetical protein NPIL_527911 [Nephila pilipes]|uniref:Uncharacterized protein n=1 Tax=Nephila pilipes TaxID=299642 RepID=A0A8X6T4I1_NEPPI|nr:hypothetical protein NPIL_527911 [Nephila pilipes]
MSSRSTPGGHPTSRIKLIMSESSKRNICKRHFTWKLLKCTVFIVCVACFSWQSANFFELYFTYPTATNIDLTYPEYLIRPAVTFCNNNPVKREIFCNKYPHLCQKPNNLTEFCEQHPYFCEGDTSKLVAGISANLLFPNGVTTQEQVFVAQECLRFDGPIFCFCGLRSTSQYP